MEANKNNSGENKSTTGNTAQNPLGGFDLNGIMNDPKIMEIIKHLLSGGGAMAGSYFIWIKPLQEKVEAMQKVMNDQEKRINDLEEALEESSDDENAENMKGTKQDYFNLKRNNREPANGYKKRSVHL
jgi:hypothetical protein